MTQTLNIIDIGQGGDGIARTEDGQSVFVPFTVTGDVVSADVAKDEHGVLRGKLVSVLQAGEGRAVPPCRHFGICGGCSLQHLNDETYVSFKRDAVLSILQKAGITLPETVEAVFIPPYTRRRANFAARVVKGKATIGFHERKSANIRNTPDCHLINNDLRDAMEKFRPFIPDLIGEGAKIDVLIQCAEGQIEIGLTGKLLTTLDATMALGDAMRTMGLARISLRVRDYEEYKILLEEKPYYKHFDSLVVNLAPGAFLQPSAEGERALTKCVIDGAGDASCIADLFCGNGTFTGPLMEGRDIVAADFAPDAIAALRRAGVNAQVRNLFKDPLRAEELKGRDCVILDPPRAGAAAQVRVLAETAVPTIVYISCNPQSFAKDAVELVQGGYVLAKLTIVDQFVWSTHTEVVGIFKKSLT